MSTKTLRKRIALATVAALGAGVLSLVSTSTASATVTYGGSDIGDDLAFRDRARRGAIHCGPAGNGQWWYRRITSG